MVIEKTQERIKNCLNEGEELRLNEKSFTRKGKLGAKRILHLILQRIYLALQLHLDNYYDEIGECPVSKQAFSKARKNLSPEYVRGFADMTSEVAAGDETMPSYEGMRLIAIDGSDAALGNTPELKEVFGCSGSKKNAATALCSLAYGPLDHVIYDCRMDRYDKDERDLAKQHVIRLKELDLDGSLLLFDRWYPSAEFIAFLYESGFHFVMRVRRKWNLEADSMKTQGWISVTHNDKTYPVRVLKITLSTGEIETLLTSLHQKQLPIRKAGPLYFERWKVETAYDLIRLSFNSKISQVNFSGKTKASVLQDFYATIYLANVAAFAAEEADKRISDADRDKELKYPRQANRNRTIAKLRSIFLCLIMEQDADLRDAMLDKLVVSIAERPVSVVPDRSPLRKPPRKKRFHMAKKSVV